MNNIKSLSENDFATLLLCSDMACDKKKLKPYSDSTYSKFAWLFLNLDINHQIYL